jgi:hypothetical protein
MSLLLALAMAAAPGAGCDEFCHLAVVGQKPTPSITTPAAENPERAFDAYFACARGKVAAAQLTGDSGNEAFSAAFLAAYDGCTAEREAGNAAMLKMILDSGAKNPRADLVLFVDQVRGLIFIGELEKMFPEGPTRRPFGAWLSTRGLDKIPLLQSGPDAK